MEFSCYRIVVSFSNGHFNRHYIDGGALLPEINFNYDHGTRCFIIWFPIAFILFVCKLLHIGEKLKGFFFNLKKNNMTKS
jgi:hypothetical protein